MNAALWERKLAACVLGAIIVLALGMREAKGAEASTQSRKPWTIGQCDRLAGRSASAVFNRSIYSRGGWPLWQVVCVFPILAVR